MPQVLPLEAAAAALVLTLWCCLCAGSASTFCDPSTAVGAAAEGAQVHEGFNLTGIVFPQDPSEAAAVLDQGCVGNFSAGNSWQTPLVVGCHTNGSYVVLSGDATCTVLPCDPFRYFDNGAEETFEPLSADGKPHYSAWWFVD